MRCLSVSSAAVLAAATVASASTFGPDWDEPGDAGPIPTKAQFLFGFGAISTIAGTLSLSALAGDDDDDDVQDMFWIVITNPVRITFSAGTADSFGGSADFDTQLWLFDSQGFGLLANDDSDGPQSGLLDAATDATGIVITEPGAYLIAISGAGSEPVDENGDALFLFTAPGEISGPDGPGGANPIAGWSDKGDVGSYLIRFEGTGFLTPGDLDANGVVDGADLGILLSLWGPCDPDTGCSADIDFDGDVDGADLGVLLSNWSG